MVDEGSEVTQRLEEPEWVWAGGAANATAGKGRSRLLQAAAFPSDKRHAGVCVCVCFPKFGWMSGRTGRWERA